MIDPTGLRVIGYCRCSSVEQGRDGLSLDVQQARIMAWAEAVEAEVVELASDEGVSGSRPLSQRPGGKRVAELIESRRPSVDAVVVLRLDRLGRDAAESLALLKKFRTGRLGLVSVAERLDLASPHGRALAGVSAVFAELERSLIAQRTAEALAELRKQGRAWNHPPFGWLSEDGRLVPMPAEQDTLALITDLRSQGLSYAKVAEKLSLEKRPTKRGGRWAAMTVRSVLRSQPSWEGR